MRSLLLVLVIIYVISIEYSAEALTVPRMRKRSLAPPTYWTDRSFEDDQPAYELSFTNQNSCLIVAFVACITPLKT